MHTNTLVLLAASLFLVACGRPADDNGSNGGPADDNGARGRAAGAPVEAQVGDAGDGPGAAIDPGDAGVFVHLFEWRWTDVARECEDFLSAAGYAAVQVSPPQEHERGPEWWTRYQPVSYKLTSRGGTREEFADMVERCRAVGVDIYVDAVINHMTGVTRGSGMGVAGTEFGEYEYPGLYTYDDFNHCGRNGNDDIVNFDDAWEVQNCELVDLSDLATHKPGVRARLAGFLNDLVGIGVAGFRIDAAKHMPADDIAAIFAMIDSNPYVFQEVIAGDDGELDRRAYLANGDITEFAFGHRIRDAFLAGEPGRLAGIDEDPALLPGDAAVVFVDNHDTQRGHWGEQLNYKQGEAYTLANVFMLGQPYGYPKVMSSFAFEDPEAGPPDVEPVAAGAPGCNDAWVCEHRRPEIAAMVEFRRLAAGEPLTRWRQHGSAAISFGRGERGHVAINLGDAPIDLAIETDLVAGSYCDMLTGEDERGCRRTIEVGADGSFVLQLEPLSAVAIQPYELQPRSRP